MTMEFRPRIALCNEVISGKLSWPEQCVFAAALGYDGLEVAPYTLSGEPHRMRGERVAEFRRIAEDHGIAVTGLHYLLLAPEGLSITSDNAGTIARTRDVIAALVELCAGLGGRVLVHGSPKQRQGGADRAGALERAEAIWAFAGEQAAAAGVTYCIEPLSPKETDIVNTFDEAAAIARRIGNPALRTMIDTSAAGIAEAEPVADLVARALPSGLIAHIQLNDRNRMGPGQGEDRFLPILRALRDGGYSGDIGIEPFIYLPDGQTSAARAIGYVRGAMEGLA